MKHFIRWITHPMAKYWAMTWFKRTNSLFTYPTLIAITFDKEKYKQQYINGKSYMKIFTDIAMKIAKSLDRTSYKTIRRSELKKEDPDFYEELMMRWIRFSQYYNDKAVEQREEEAFNAAEVAFNAL